MYLSGDAKDLLYKCTILTAMMRRLTRYFPHVFKFLGKQNKSQRKTMLFVARHVSNAQADLSLRHSHVPSVSLLLVHVQPSSIQTIRPV